MSTDRSAMAPSNVFGVPINDEFVGDPTTAFMRARLAFDLKNHGGKRDEALQYVNGLKSSYGDGTCCQCLVYNATGDAINFQKNYKDWNGHIWEDSSYPVKLENGEWGAFLHVQDGGDVQRRSAAGIVYRGKNDKGKRYDYLCSWSIQPGKENKSYSVVRNVSSFIPDTEWSKIHTSTEHARDPGTPDNNRDGCTSNVSIDDEDHSPVYKAILTLKGVD